MRAGIGPGAALVALAALLAGGAAADDGIGLPLRQVHFEVDAWIDSASLRRALPLTLGEPVTAAQLEDARRVLDQTGIFRSIGVSTVADDGAVVTFHLKRKRVITEVTVRGYDALRWREVHRVLRLRTGQFYDPALVEAARQRLLTRYERSGFPRAEVIAQVRRVVGEATVQVTIREGAPTRVETLVIAGETGVPSDELEPALRRVVGEPYRRDSVRTATRELVGRLRDAGYYDAQVDVEWVPDSETAGTLRVTVDAGPRTVIEVVGNAARSERQLLGLMDLRSRLIVTDGTWRELARRMRRAYQERGFYRATVKVSIGDGDPRRVRFTVDEGRVYAVRRVDFSGNQQMSAGALRDEMNTQPARTLPWPRRGAFVRKVFDEDLRRLWFFYREQGFAGAEIVDAPVEVEDDTGAIDILVVVSEGPRSVVAAVEPPDLEGVTADPPALALAPGAPLLPATLAADTEAIRATLRRDGYGDARVEPEVTRRDEGEVARAQVRWTVDRGVRRTVGAIIVQGNVETYDEIIRRALPFAAGDPLDPEVLQRGQENVYELGTYRSVAVRPLEPEVEAPTVGVEVQPRAPGSVQWGLGYNTRDGFTGFGELTYDNIGHRARRLTLRAQGSITPDDLASSQYLGLVGYRVPQVFGSPWAWNLQAIGERSTKTINQYDIVRGSLATGFTRALGPRVRLNLEAQAGRADVFNVKPASFRDIDTGIFYATALSPSLIYDGRNDPFAPTSGVFDSIALRYAPPGVSTVQFGTVNLQHTQAIPLARWLSFIYSAQLGYGGAFSGAPVLPIQERFFIGGSTSVRGFAENSIGPTDRYGRVLGGDFASVLSLELRIPIMFGISGAVFNDNGGLFVTQCDDACEFQRGVLDNAFTFENFRHSIGPGLRYMTPVGPISLDYGFKLDRRGPRVVNGIPISGESIGEVHFSISGTF